MGYIGDGNLHFFVTPGGLDLGIAANAPRGA